MGKFIQILRKFYSTHKRSSLPWRKTKDVYHILLSEVMLQQTQVSRVLIKYAEFLAKFPTVERLVAAPLREVLIAWQGLGYNRRAKFLHQTAIALGAAAKKELGDYTFLCSLPGVGQSTAGAILAFTKNIPVVFIETNIRAVILHHFFTDSTKKVSDKEIISILETLLKKLPKDFGPRDFYYAMYDYGSYLKQSLGTQRKALHSKSTSYVKQSKFQGSRRQLRAFILKNFLGMEGKKNFKKVLVEKVLKNKPRVLEEYKEEDVKNIIDELENEGMFQ